MTTKIFKIMIFLLLSASSLCQDDHHQGHDHSQEEQNLIPISQRWGFGFLAGFGISLIGFVTAIVLVCSKNIASDFCFSVTIKFLFSLAFGALLGDALIHLLPAGYSTEGIDFRVTAGIFIGAILLFIILQRIFAVFGIAHKHWHQDPLMADQDKSSKNDINSRKIHNRSENNERTTKIQQIASNDIIAIENNGMNSKDKTPDGQNTSDNEKSCWQNLKGKGSAGYMNLLGSFIHNFMDGLGLGVGFATGDSKVYVPILIAIIAHEIPRQMGDVAILMTNQFSSTQTILCNGFVNFSSLIGVFIGLAIVDLSSVTKTYILIFVAGNFVYIAADIWRHLFQNKGFVKNLIEFLGFAVGITAMYLILLLQEGQQGHSH